MVHQDKHTAYMELKGAIHLNKDKALLEKLKPSSRALRGLANPDKEKVQADILWDLLDVASKDEILRSRDLVDEIAPPSDPKPPPHDPQADHEKTPEEILIELDLDNNPDDKVMKKLIKDLNVTGITNKRKNRIAALKKAKKELMNPAPVETPEPDLGEGEKNQETEASKGTGVSNDSVGEPGGSGHPKSSDSLQ